MLLKQVSDWIFLYFTTILSEVRKNIGKNAIIEDIVIITFAKSSSDKASDEESDIMKASLSYTQKLVCYYICK